MSDHAEGKDSLSGLSEREAQVFHQLFVSSAIGFTAVAFVAHILVWIWRPWLPPVKGYAASLINDVTPAVSAVVSMIA